MLLLSFRKGRTNIGFVLFLDSFRELQQQCLVLEGVREKERERERQHTYTQSQVHTMSKRSEFASNRSKLSVYRNLKLSDDEVDAIIEGFAEEDEISGKTWSRRLVEDYLSKVRERKRERTCVCVDAIRRRTVGDMVNSHRFVSNTCVCSCHAF